MKSAAVILLCGLAAVPEAQAFLPRDADVRQQEVLEYRQRKRVQYEQMRQQYEQGVVSSDTAVRQLMNRPLWMRGTLTPGITGAADFERGLADGTDSQRNHRIFVSVVLLILIGAAAAWARHATREIDE